MSKSPTLHSYGDGAVEGHRDAEENREKEKMETGETALSADFEDSADLKTQKHDTESHMKAQRHEANGVNTLCLRVFVRGVFRALFGSVTPCNQWTQSPSFFRLIRIMRRSAPASRPVRDDAIIAQRFIAGYGPPVLTRPVRDGRGLRGLTCSECRSVLPSLTGRDSLGYRDPSDESLGYYRGSLTGPLHVAPCAGARLGARAHCSSQRRSARSCTYALSG